MRESFKILIILIIAIIARIRFFSISFLPFSTDSWPLIKNTEIIIQDGSLQSLYGNYNANWPASQIFSAILSESLNLKPIYLMGLIFPLLGAFSVLVYYVFIKRILGTNIAFLSSLFLALSGYNVFFTSGVTKETFTMTLFFTALFSFYMLVEDKRMAPFFLISSIGVLLAHHFTYLNLILPIIFFASALTINNITEEKEINKIVLYALIFLSISGLLYYNLFTYLKIYNIQNPNQIFVFASFQLFLLIIFTKLKIINKETNSYKGIIPFLSIVILSIYLSLRLNLFDITIVANIWYLTFLLIGLLILILSYVGYKRIEKEKKIFLLSLITPFIAFYAYSIFSASFGDATVFATRLLDFILPFSFPLAAFGLFAIKKKQIRIALLLTILIAFIFQNIAIYPLQLNGSGYQWIYTNGEFEGANFLSSFSKANNILADYKMDYLLGYFNLSSEVFKGYQVLNGDSKPESNSLIIIYNQMYYNGYVLLYKGESIKQLDQIDLYSKIYSNKDFEVYYVA